ncbi:hypothetical protein [Gordonia aurantiaca]|uniref:hypothetical protein n=1 Tax=Gordonia sp. B21 TaxID=3151852 RepID=UPI0032669D05
MSRAAQGLVDAGVAGVLYPLSWVLRPMAWVRRQTGIPLRFQLFTVAFLFGWVDYVFVEAPDGWSDWLCFAGYSFWLGLMVIQVLYALWQGWAGRLPDESGPQKPGSVGVRSNESGPGE